MKKRVISILTLISWSNMFAQVIDSLNQEASPSEGINQLAIMYYGIDFTKEQRTQIKNIEIEFIYSIDELGNPTLLEVNGVNDLAILDSLQHKTAEIEPFKPRIKDGIAEPSIYFMKLTFPSYKISQRTYGLIQGAAYNEAKLEDFEYLYESGQRLDMVIGGFANQHIGKPSKHLAVGGGMKLDLNYSTRNRLFYGLNMAFAQNGLKQNYPVNSQRDQISPVTGFVGLTVGKWINNFSIETDISLAVHNVTKKIGDNDPDWVQLNGWSPGIIVNYPILLGREDPVYYYGAPTLIGNNLNLSIGLRYVSFSLKEASGLMAELGVSYRMAIKGVKEYRLKQDFIDK